jgi:hypothetical protein
METFKKCDSSDAIFDYGGKDCVQRLAIHVSFFAAHHKDLYLLLPAIAKYKGVQQICIVHEKAHLDSSQSVVRLLLNLQKAISSTSGFFGKDDGATKDDGVTKDDGGGKAPSVNRDISFDDLLQLIPEKLRAAWQPILESDDWKIDGMTAVELFHSWPARSDITLIDEGDL